MKLTQITVSYGMTQSLPEYSNVKPQLTLTATLDEDDTPEAVEAALWAHAKTTVREEIDRTLEACGQAAKWSEEPRYQVMRTYQDRYNRPKDAPEMPKIVVVFPNDLELDRERFGARFVHALYAESRKLRYAYAIQEAAKVAEKEGATLLDCTDGNLDRLLDLLPSVEAEPDHPF